MPQVQVRDNAGIEKEEQMDLQEILSNAVAVARAEEMKTSPQLTLGELILMLEAVGNKGLPVVFDEPKYHPTRIDSWRGAYDELALNYTAKGETLTVWDVIALLKRAIGTTFQGYKGGDYTMGKTTPVWVGNYGEGEGFREGGNTAVVSIREEATAVLIETAVLEY